MQVDLQIGARKSALQGKGYHSCALIPKPWIQRSDPSGGSGRSVFCFRQARRCKAEHFFVLKGGFLSSGSSESSSGREHHLNPGQRRSLSPI